MSRGRKAAEAEQSLGDAYARIAAAYLCRPGATRDEDWWAVDAVWEAVNADDPEHAWRIVIALVADASDEDRLRFVGAGAVADLVHRFGTVLVDRIEAEARADSRFFRALADVLVAEDELPPVVLRRIVDASGGAIRPLRPLGHMPPFDPVWTPRSSANTE